MERRPRQSTPVGTGKVPWLVFSCGKDFKDQTFCTLSDTGNTSVELKTIPELRNNKVWGCYHGWLLLSTHDYQRWSLWNPITYESINLPPFPSELIGEVNFFYCIFTTSPKDPGCTVVLFDNGTTTIMYCKPGDQHWTKHNYGRDLLKIGEDMEQASTLCEVACLDGVIYANSYKHLVAIEFDNQNGVIKIGTLGIGQADTKMFTGHGHTFLVESFGELYAVYLLIGAHPNNIVGVEVFRRDFSRKVWVEVENLDSRSIFLASKWNCTSCLATETGLMGNRIYFMTHGDKHLYMYDLEEGTVLDSLPCPRLQNPWYRPFWVMPEYPHIDVEVDVKPKYKISKVLEQHTKVEVEVQSPRDMEASGDQYPDNFKLDALTEIARHLQPLDYLEFRATSRFFRSAAPATQWSITSIMYSLQSPWLVTFRRNKSIFNFTDPKHNNTYSMKVPEKLRGTLISGSKGGYLAMVDGKTVFYFNPFTRMQVKLPESFNYDNRLSFSSSPSSSDWLAVNIDEYTSEVKSIRAKADHWDVHELETEDQAFELGGRGVFHKGMFYFLGQKGNIGVLKEIEGGFSWKVLQKPEAPCNAIYHSYLMECDGQLMAVFLGRYGNWVKVFRLDCVEEKMIWRRVMNLRNYTLFLSNIASIAAVARSQGMENKVYFPRFYDQRIVYYSLETEKFHTHGSNATLDNFVGTKEQLYCTWIQPGVEID